MTSLDITTLVISLLSLIATLSISFNIYFIELRKQRERKIERLQQEAKQFIINNLDEKDFIVLCQFIYKLYKHDKHTRKIYYEFVLLNEPVQKEVFKQLEILNIVDFKDNEWIANKFSILKDIVNDYQLGNWDDYKFYENFNFAYTLFREQKCDTVFEEIKQNKFGGKNLSFHEYLNEYAHRSKESDMLAPIDYFIDQNNLNNVFDRQKHAIYKLCLLDLILNELCRSMNNDHRINNEFKYFDCEVIYVEDLYLKILYKLYFQLN
ncbi:hypothetical protein [Ureaplasma parvum]|uniref:hypothetical protein n=1 Tax=Ureaplasma parvum TaxID=134821 RepID=UPI0026EEA430|nr:hypothetical protein [Ureaplasma parvum]